MRKNIYTLIVLAVTLLTTACNDYETYGELKEKERDNIRQFIADSSFVVIDEAQFHTQGDLTVGTKQFVYLTKSGIYMQILSKGCGEMIKDGECGVFSEKLLACFEFARQDMEKLVAETKAAEQAEKEA